MTMASDPITAVSDLASTIIGRIWPDKTEQEKAQMAAALTIVQGQLDANKVEAGSTSWFVAGWRPFVGWVCGMGCAWNWVGLPIATFATTYFGHPLGLKPADLSEMMPLLIGMLGLGAYRTAEKIQGAEGNR